MEVPIFKDLIVVIGLSIAVGYLCYRCHIPFLVGLLITGVISGPYGLGLVSAVDEVEMLAELGIALLLFTIGLELSLKRFLQSWRQVLGGGALQVFITLSVGVIFALSIGREIREAVFLGCLLSLSSTAIVLKLFQDRYEVSTPQGEFSLSILVFQDIIVVPMLMLVPLLSGNEISFSISFWWVVVEGIAILVAILLAGYWLVPRALYYITQTQSKNLFLLSVLFICFSTAWVSHWLGLSLAFGAFLAGLIVSDTEYNTHTLGNVLPLQTVFMTFFFISTGMLLELSFVGDYFFLILLALLGIFILKSSTMIAVSLLFGYSLRTALIVGLSLFQVGEFSLLLMKQGIIHEISNPFYYQLFLAMTLFSMALTPLVINNSPRIVDFLMGFPWPNRLKHGIDREREDASQLKGHTIVIGYGVSGKNLVTALKSVRIPYLVLELSPKGVARGRREGEPIIFGDATHEAVLRHLNIFSAKVVAIQINDPVATRHIVAVVRRLNPKIMIIVRARNVEDIQRLRDLGADEVVPDELESSVEIFSRVMRKNLIPQEEIDQVAADVRSGQYEMFRSPLKQSATLKDLMLNAQDMKIETFRVSKNSEIEGQSLRGVDLRGRFKVTVLLIRREGSLLSDINPEEVLQKEDLLVLFGHPSRLSEVAILFSGYCDS